MAPIAPTRANKEKKVESILSFARNLQNRLELDISSAILATEVRQYINDFPGRLGMYATSRYDDLDLCGTALWNLSIRLKRNNGSDAEKETLLCVRVFAFMLLDCAQQSSRGSTLNCIRLLKVALKTAKHTLERRNNDYTLIVLEKAAQYEGEICKPSNQTTSVHSVIHSRLTAEYLMLRTGLAWRQSRLDIAEHMFNKANLVATQLDPNVAEEFADLLYEIGKDLLDRRQHKLAAKWLDRAYHILLGQDLEMLSSDAGELRISVMHGSGKQWNYRKRTEWKLTLLRLVVKALLGLQDEEARTKAWDLVNMMENDFGDKLVMLLLKLELLCQGSTFEAQSFYEVLKRIIRTVFLTESNLKTIVHQIHVLKARAPELACHAVDELLLIRGLSPEQHEWVEKLFITRLWITVGLPDQGGVLDTSRRLFDKLLSNLAKPLTAAATHAAQSLLWKRVESTYNQGQYELSGSWCRLLLHSMFGKSGDLNTARISRKLILCALCKQDFTAALDVFNQMSEVGKTAPLTNYLMYKVAVRIGDTSLAADCLETICNKTSKDATLLYACVLEAQQTGDRALAATAMQHVLERYGHGAPDGVHLPALLRCAARLLMTEPSGSEMLQVEHVASICKLFEGDMDTNTMIELTLRRIFCDFLCTSLLITLARAEDRIENQLQYYLESRTHTTDFRIRLQGQLTNFQGGAKDDLLRKHSTLISFDFEAAVELKAWDDLGQLVEEASHCTDGKAFGIMADIILCSEAPSMTIILTLQKIINTAWQSEGNDIVKLSRWIRCLFQIAMPSESSIAQHLLGQKDGSEYPTEELEWLATTTFNRAVDFYCASDDTACRWWAEKALCIASLSDDGGGLHSMLQSNTLKPAASAAVQNRGVSTSKPQTQLTLTGTSTSTSTLPYQAPTHEPQPIQRATKSQRHAKLNLLLSNTYRPSQPLALTLPLPELPQHLLQKQQRRVRKPPKQRKQIVSRRGRRPSNVDVSIRSRSEAGEGKGEEGEWQLKGFPAAYGTTGMDSLTALDAVDSKAFGDAGRDGDVMHVEVVWGHREWSPDRMLWDRPMMRKMFPNEGIELQGEVVSLVVNYSYQSPLEMPPSKKPQHKLHGLAGHSSALRDATSSISTRLASLHLAKGAVPSWYKLLRYRSSIPSQLKSLSGVSFPQLSRQTKAKEEGFPFQRLPPELRIRVYTYALVRPAIYPFKYKTGHKDFRGLSYAICKNDLRDPPTVSLLGTSRTIYEESREILYASNKFVFEHPAVYLRFLDTTFVSETQSLRALEFRFIALLVSSSRSFRTVRGWPLAPSLGPRGHDKVVRRLFSEWRFVLCHLPLGLEYLTLNLSGYLCGCLLAEELDKLMSSVGKAKCNAKVSISGLSYGDLGESFRRDLEAVLAYVLSPSTNTIGCPRALPEYVL
ncbi:MAG: hypothetical protein M1827_005026 [Pycnora praestabilis]|nr:MAG: hypothetical protein M1827_005026 [Pycnora praestabilis]